VGQNEREIGLRIAAARRERGLTQAEFAKLVGVTSRSVQAYEAGKIVPWRHLDRFEEITRRPRSWFLRGSADPGPAPTPTELEERLVLLVGRVASEAERLFEATARLAELLERREAANLTWAPTPQGPRALPTAAGREDPPLPA
jgi:transcriptional regulator with XRE-family HTH domain